MHRRNMLKNLSALAGIGTIAATVGSRNILASYDAHGHPPKKGLHDDPLIDILRECIATCDLCASHCIESQSGPHLVECIQACRDCSAVCEAMAKLASSHSPHLRAYAALCADVCRACAAICRSRPGPMTEHCAKVCEQCAEECEKAAG